MPGSSSYQGKKAAKGSIRDCEQSDSNKKEQVNTSECIMPDIVQENQALATKVNSSVSGMTSNQEVELSKLGFFSTDDIYHTPDTNVEVLEMANPRTKNLNEQAEEDVQILEVKKNSQPVKEVNAHKEKPEDSKSKKVHNDPIATKHSSKVHDDGRTVMEKAMEKKATALFLKVYLLSLLNPFLTHPLILRN